MNKLTYAQQQANELFCQFMYWLNYFIKRVTKYLLKNNNNLRPMKYPVTGALVVPFPAPLMGVTLNWYITLMLALLCVKLNSGVLTKSVLTK